MPIDILQDRIRKLKNPVMLDFLPTPAILPPELQPAEQESGMPAPEALAEAYLQFGSALLERLSTLTPAVCISFSAFAVLGAPGISALQSLLTQARKLGFYVLLDWMQGGSAPEAQAAAAGILGDASAYPCDAVTCSGYAGSDAVKPFLPYCRSAGKNLFVPVRSVGRSAAEIQELMTGGRLVYTAMADLVSRWGADSSGKYGYAQVAAVAGASHPAALQTLRQKYDRMFLLVTGCGTPGIGLKNAVPAFDRLGRGAVIAVSDSISAAWKKSASGTVHFAEAAAVSAEKLRKELSKLITVL